MHIAPNQPVSNTQCRFQMRRGNLLKAMVYTQTDRWRRKLVIGLLIRRMEETVMKSFAALLSVGLLCLSASTMRADGVGTPVTGNLVIPIINNVTNWWNADFGFVPAGYGNSNLVHSTTVTISNGITEFGFSNNTDLITADFTGSTLTLTESCVGGGTCSLFSYTATFFDPQFAIFNTISSAPGFSPFSFDLTNQLLTATFTVPAGVPATGGSLVLGYTVTPEPGTLGLMATGLLGVAGVIRRRFLA
jgi:hypothetical protein